MDKATKSVSSLAAFFILFLVIFEMPEIEAQDSECLKEYGGDVGFGFCAPRIYPTFCVKRCRADKGALGGKCIWGQGSNVKCLCNFCRPEPGQILSGI
ncbi:PREDICTED: defensin-like protein 4 [Brassica oleracea var. oleracea]|uniref:Knottins-like domain-containing protein n=1 Tax=Brassica oleracea var. oleracea TaxID=109376 RepID=A0A0D3C627_BRAOL|nr:PREDICTED: defensin-like protein 4 [Brassica oleracea var. oleracea]